MKRALQKSTLCQPASWWDYPQGSWLNKQEERQLNQWWPRIFGYHMLKLGNLSALLDTSVSNIKNQINVCDNPQIADVCADLYHLPFSENAVDAVLLAHCLDHSNDPHQMLREAHRVLIPDGYMIITGFNPMSLCGLYRYLPNMKTSPPWNGRFFSPHRIHDWLSLLGCEVIEEHRFVHRSLCSQPSSLMQKLVLKNRWLTRYSHSVFAYFGAVYIIVARKRELPLTPVKQKWKVNTNISAVNIGSARM